MARSAAASLLLHFCSETFLQKIFDSVFCIPLLVSQQLVLDQWLVLRTEADAELLCEVRLGRDVREKVGDVGELWILHTKKAFEGNVLILVNNRRFVSTWSHDLH